MELEFEVCLCGKEICDEKCTLSLINNINIIDNFDNHQLYIDDHINIIKTQKTIKDKAYNLNLYNRKYFNTKDFFENFFSKNDSGINGKYCFNCCLFRSKYYYETSLNVYDDVCFRCKKISTEQLNEQILKVNSHTFCKKCRKYRENEKFIDNKTSFKTCSYCRLVNYCRVIKDVSNLFYCSGCKCNKKIEEFMKGTKQLKTCIVCRNINKTARNKDG